MLKAGIQWLMTTTLPTFNAYDGGPGALMQSSKSSNQENQISLFVGNIPLSITKVHNINLLHEHYVAL